MDRLEELLKKIGLTAKQRRAVAALLVEVEFSVHGDFYEVDGETQSTRALTLDQLVPLFRLRDPA